MKWMLNSEELLDWVFEMQNKTGYALEYPDVYHNMTSNRSQCARFGEGVVSNQIKISSRAES